MVLRIHEINRAAGGRTIASDHQRLIVTNQMHPLVERRSGSMVGLENAIVVEFLS